MSDPRIGRGSGGVPYRIPTADPTSIQRPGTEPTTDVWGGRAHKIGKLAANFGRGALDALGADLPEALRLLTTLHDRTDEPKPGEAMLAGRGVSPGVGSGPVISSPAEAAELRAAGRPYVYALDHVSSANVEAAVGASALVVLDRKKNNASRAVASIGKPVVALPHAAFDRAKQATDVTVDGTRGLVRFGALPTIAGGANEAARATLGRLRVAAGANVVAEASTPATVRQAVALGATDVRVDADALLTTDAVLTPLRRYLLETEAAPRLELIEQIVAEVRANAEALVEAAGDATLTFAIGSRSPKSFFPVRPELLDRVADEIGLPAAVVQERVADLGSGNSKLGLRGGRLGVKFPDLFAGIGRAVFEAVADAKEDGHASGNVKLLVPAVSLPGEIDTLKKKLEGEREAVQADFGVELDVKYGAGIETAAGALQMAEISAIADFAEYGLAEMTETVMGISREDADSFVPHLVESGVYPADPFERPAFDLLDKLIAVSQYVAGDTPNSFPATVRGAMTVDPNGMMLARQAGVRDVVVPRDLYVDGLIEAARTTHALEQVFGANLGRTKPSDRDTAAKTFKLLETRLAPMSGEVGGKIPEGVTALEHVERLIRQESRGNLSKADALLSLDADIVDSLRRPVIDPRAQIKVLSKGAGASPGCGVGKLALSHDAAEAFAAKGEPYVLLVNEVHAEDVPAVRDAEALVSVRGGVTSHSAMIAANSDVPCVMDDKAKINLEKRTAQLGRTMVKEGDWISVDGTKGQVIAGEAPLIDPAASPAYATLMQWADELRTLEVHANADTPAEAKLAFESGAEGVGLVRSEHMFFGENRLLAFRSAIVGDGAKAEAALEDMEAFQRADFEGLFTAAAGKKVAVRLLDPPLYEFLPNSPDGIRELAKRLDLSTEEVVRRIDDAQEVDSLMGLRGARLAEVRPDIEATQVRALAKAFAATKANGIDPKQLYITVPMVNTGREMEAAAARIKALVAEVEAETGQKIPVQVGAMIETPAAALEAGRIAQHSDYRSYGTNDLTQLTLGFGRNVAPKFIPELIANGALAADPSKMLDPDTVGKTVHVAAARGELRTSAGLLASLALATARRRRRGVARLARTLRLRRRRLGRAARGTLLGGGGGGIGLLLEHNVARGNGLFNRVVGRVELLLGGVAEHALALRVRRLLDAELEHRRARGADAAGGAALKCPAHNVNVLVDDRETSVRERHARGEEDEDARRANEQDAGEQQRHARERARHCASGETTTTSGFLVEAGFSCDLMESAMVLCEMGGGRGRGRGRMCATDDDDDDDDDDDSSGRRTDGGGGRRVHGRRDDDEHDDDDDAIDNMTSHSQRRCETPS